MTKLYVETRSLAEQYDFYGSGDLMFAECSVEHRRAFMERVEGRTRPRCGERRHIPRWLTL